jgi:hypothetical protein
MTLQNITIRVRLNALLGALKKWFCCYLYLSARRFRDNICYVNMPIAS